LPFRTPITTVAAVVALRPDAVGSVLLDEAESGMSQRIVERLIGRQVPDEELRLEFTRDPRETLATRAELGWDLTGVEVDTLLRTDTRLWSDAAARGDPRLQRCSLKTSEEPGAGP